MKRIREGWQDDKDTVNVTLCSNSSRMMNASGTCTSYSGTSQHCPISTATTHIGSNCACSGDQSRFGLVLVTHLDQSKAVPVSHPKPVMPLFRAVVTVWRSGYTFHQWPSTPNYSTAFIE